MNVNFELVIRGLKDDIFFTEQFFTLSNALFSIHRVRLLAKRFWILKHENEKQVIVTPAEGKLRSSARGSETSS